MPDNLFSELGQKRRQAAAPLAFRLRPQTLDDVVGQPHLLKPGGVVRSMAETRLRSAIFFGPAGCGKTTVADLLARAGGYFYVAMSAVEVGVPDIKKVAQAARERWDYEGRGTVLFLDEIHRFSKSQQDALLPHVEDGTLVLLGATTENPWVSINAALISRCLVVEFKALDDSDVVALLTRAWSRRREWWHDGEADPNVWTAIARRTGGDARLALTVLERAAALADHQKTAHITLALVDEVWQSFAHYYDAHGDHHYDLASAFIKSIRGSDPDAALYWMGRMLVAGEDPRFIVRRLIVHAAEDIGLADPRALWVATSAWQALEAVGLPEARIPIAEAVIYLATAPKSNSVVAALAALDQLLARHPDLPVPDRLRDRHYRPDIREPYRYPHDAPDHFLPDPYLPSALQTVEIYHPTRQGQEARVHRRLARWRDARQKARESRA